MVRVDDFKGKYCSFHGGSATKQRITQTQVCLPTQVQDHQKAS